MHKVKITGYLFLFVCIAGLMIYSAIKSTRSVRRDIPTLLNFYYDYKDKDPLKAKDALDLILEQDPSYATALYAKGNWFIQQGDTHAALLFFERSHLLYPNDANIEFELANLYIMLGQFVDAKPILKKLLISDNAAVKKNARALYQSIFPQELLPITQIARPSFIEPLRIISKQDWAPLYAKIQEVIQLQPDSARNYLHLILSEDPNEFQAYVKLSYLELQEKNPDIALQYFLKAFALKPSAQLAAQIGYLYVEKRNRDQAMTFFKYGATYGHGLVKQQSFKALVFLEKNPYNIPSKQAENFKLSLEDKLWNSYYSQKIKQPVRALQSINSLLKRHPNDLRTLKEAAYFATIRKDFDQAIALWKRAYSLDENPDYAMNIAYLYDTKNFKPKAFHYFYLASKTTDIKKKTKAELARTNMGGSQFKSLPSPYFAEFYAAPFYFSRFNLGVLPTITRAGIRLNEKHSTDAYFSWRRTKDNRSGTIQGLIIQNSISQIFEDNVGIYAGGLRTYPWPKIPLLMFVEVGEAQDLVYRYRPKWRGDVRSGLVYYNDWGEKPTWTSGVTFPLKWITTFYADTIYYSRYDNNIIGTAWLRPGIRAATFKSASLDFYLGNYLLLDKDKEFFNNEYILAPGVAFRPSNRINVVFRLEAWRGYYLPVNSPTPNPYGSKFRNNFAMVEVYFNF